MVGTLIASIFSDVYSLLSPFLVNLTPSLMVFHRGYMSPGYASEGLYSTKSDVFSFGVLVLEIVSGQRNNRGFDHPDHDLNLLGHVITW